MQMDPLLIKMHDDIDQHHVFHRERCLEILSLDLALLPNIIVHLYSGVSDKI